MPYHIGDRVEVFRFPDQNVDTFFEATILEMGPNHFGVQYQTLLDMQNQPLVSVVPITDIRPYPNRIRATFNPGDDVNAWVGNSWLRGRYRRYQGNESRRRRQPERLVHRVHFPHLPEGERLRSFQSNDVRLHQEFEFADNLQLFGTWTYRRMMRMGYQTGNRVEMLGAEPAGFEHSYYEATVIYVFPYQVMATYETLQDDNNEPLEGLVLMEYVRPYPSRIPVNYSPGDVVDVFYNDGWWLGTYHEYQPNNPDGLRHQIHFDYMVSGHRQSNYRRADIRLHQDFEFEDNLHMVALWTYTRRI